MKQKILTMILIGGMLFVLLIGCKKSSGKRTGSDRATQAGLQQADGSFIPWDNLGIDVETDYAVKNRETEAKRPYIVFSENGYNGELVLPDNITSIGEYAFGDCKSLTNIDLPDTLTNIGEGAFKGCLSLENIDLPDTLISLGEFVFWWCSLLKNINYAGTKEQWQTLIENSGSDWNTESAIETITCSDGVITL